MTNNLISKRTIVFIAGKFDPIHDGHLEHIIKASKLGDTLVIITHSDAIIAKTSSKKKCFIPEWARILILKGIMKELKIRGWVKLSIDEDGTITKTLEETINRLRPDLTTDWTFILAKGGDRTPDNMPESEIKVCRDLGIEIKYGIGDLLNSSSKITSKI